MKEYWLPMASHDFSLLHMFVGCAVAQIDGYRTIGMQGLKHLQKTITVVNQRLEDPRTIATDGTLAIIAAMAIFEVQVLVDLHFPHKLLTMYR
jgi:hypothetical protein